jgi:hypothetical protein
MAKLQQAKNRKSAEIEESRKNIFRVIYFYHFFGVAFFTPLGNGLMIGNFT